MNSVLPDILFPHLECPVIFEQEIQITLSSCRSSSCSPLLVPIKFSYSFPVLRAQHKEVSLSRLRLPPSLAGVDAPSNPRTTSACTLHSRCGICQCRRLLCRLECRRAQAIPPTRWCCCGEVMTSATSKITLRNEKEKKAAAGYAFIYSSGERSANDSIELRQYFVISRKEVKRCRECSSCAPPVSGTTRWASGRRHEFHPGKIQMRPHWSRRRRRPRSRGDRGWAF